MLKSKYGPSRVDRVKVKIWRVEVRVRPTLLVLVSKIWMSQTREESEIKLAQYVRVQSWIILFQIFLRQSYFANNMWYMWYIRNNSVANDNVSNIFSQFYFLFFDYLRHLHLRQLDLYSNPNMEPTDPNLAPHNLNLDPVSPNLGPYISCIMHWQINSRGLYFI